MYHPVLLYIVTPTLGCLRNYIKYKRCNFITFIRTPIVYTFFHCLFTLMDLTNVVWRTLIFERWYFFIEKSLISIWNNDYIKNKAKYIINKAIKSVEHILPSTNKITISLIH